MADLNRTKEEIADNHGDILKIYQNIAEVHKYITSDQPYTGNLFKEAKTHADVFNSFVNCGGIPFVITDTILVVLSAFVREDNNNIMNMYSILNQIGELVSQIQLYANGQWSEDDQAMSEYVGEFSRKVSKFVINFSKSDLILNYNFINKFKANPVSQAVDFIDELSSIISKDYLSVENMERIVKVNNLNCEINQDANLDYDYDGRLSIMIKNLKAIPESKKYKIISAILKKADDVNDVDINVQKIFNLVTSKEPYKGDVIKINKLHEITDDDKALKLTLKLRELISSAVEKSVTVDDAVKAFIEYDIKSNQVTKAEAFESFVNNYGGLQFIITDILSNIVNYFIDGRSLKLGYYISTIFSEIAHVANIIQFKSFIKAVDVSCMEHTGNIASYISKITSYAIDNNIIAQDGKIFDYAFLNYLKTNTIPASINLIETIARRVGEQFTIENMEKIIQNNDLKFHYNPLDSFDNKESHELSHHDTNQEAKADL